MKEWSEDTSQVNFFESRWVLMIWTTMSIWWWKSSWKMMTWIEYQLSDEVKVFVDNIDHNCFRNWIKDCVLAHPSTTDVSRFLPKSFYSEALVNEVLGLWLDFIFQLWRDSKCSLLGESAVLAPSRTSCPCRMVEFLTQGCMGWLQGSRHWPSCCTAVTPSSLLPSFVTKELLSLDAKFLQNLNKSVLEAQEMRTLIRTSKPKMMKAYGSSNSGLSILDSNQMLKFCSSVEASNCLLLMLTMILFANFIIHGWLGHSLFSKNWLHYCFCTRNHGHCLPLETQICYRFWSRTFWRLVCLTNFWGKTLKNQ